MSTVRGSAPGRLDLLGGVADYSGALVLETPTRLVTTVIAEPADALIVGPARFADDSIGIDRFGASAPGDVVLDRLGINVDHVVERAKALAS